VKKLLFAATLITAFSVFAMGADMHMTARQAGNANHRANTAITLTPPHACTFAKGHPCLYYGGDFNANDPNANGYTDENTLLIPNSYTYTEVKAPASAHISGSFGNSQESFGILDPQTAEWDIRQGVSEGNGGTDLCSGNGAALNTATGRNAFGLNEYEVLTATPCSIPAGNTFLAVVPNCTNSGDGDCSSGRYFESTTDGTLDAINGNFTITSNNGVGPVLNSSFFGINWGSWCNDLGLCGEGMSFGVLK